MLINAKENDWSFWMGSWRAMSNPIPSQCCGTGNAGGQSVVLTCRKLSQHQHITVRRAELKQQPQYLSCVAG